METEDFAQKTATSYDQIASKQQALTLDQNRHVPFRSFNNFVKKKLIELTLNHIRILRLMKQRCCEREIPGAVVVDLASGRGGDLGKWIYGQHPPLSKATIGLSRGVLKVARYFAIDVSSQSVEESKRRLNELTSQHTVECSFHTADCFSAAFWGEVCPFIIVPESIDVVSCQFALHYSCRTTESLLLTLKGVSALLRVGGVFVGTIVNSEELQRRVDASRFEFDNSGLSSSLFQITFPEKSEQPMPLGHRYHFHLDGLVDCDEFVVLFKDLCSVAGSVGLRLLDLGSTNFAEFVPLFEKQEAARERSGKLRVALGALDSNLVSLYRTFAFEKV